MPPSTVKVDRSTRWGNPYRVVMRYFPGSVVFNKYNGCPRFPFDDFGSYLEAVVGDSFAVDGMGRLLFSFAS